VTAEPMTEAGRALLERLSSPYSNVVPSSAVPFILAIEAQARDAERARIAAAVQRLPAHNHGTMSDWLVRRAVLAIVAGDGS
jgi:hypothetical protein